MHKARLQKVGLSFPMNCDVMFEKACVVVKMFLGTFPLKREKTHRLPPFACGVALVVPFPATLAGMSLKPQG